MWREEIVEKSWEVLLDLKGLGEFILIGGWAVYLWARKLKSRDIDVYLDQDSFYRLQGQLSQRGIPVRKNPRLRKFEAIITGVDVDIYTPFLSRLVIPCADVFRDRLFSVVEGFNVAIPEALLLLKAQVAGERWNSEKGLKDRVDIISLLAFVDVKAQAMKALAEKYDGEGKLLDVVKRVLKESRREYGYLNLTFERDRPRLQRILGDLGAR